MPDVRLQVLYLTVPIGQSVAVEGESIYEWFGGKNSVLIQIVAFGDATHPHSGDANGHDEDSKAPQKPAHQLRNLS